MTVTPPPRTNVYVDGFNLYFGCLKDTPHRWLDLAALCAKVLPDNQINHIRYFTAPVVAHPSDPTKPDRQQVYLRAIRTIRNLTIHEGSYALNKVTRELVTPLADGTTHVRVLDPKEKGSDVALATYLLADGFKQDYEVATVVSNDSDLCLPIETVRRELGLTVIVLAPVSRPGRFASKQLLRVATSLLSLRESSIRACQFAPTLVDAVGTITKPAGW